MNQQTTSPDKKSIRVLLVDDSPLSVEIIRRMLATAPEIQIVGNASNGVQALDMIPGVKPDVICTDLHMPKMDGLELTREVMATHPLPILVMSVSVQPDQTQNIFQMLEAGALDILAKPRDGLGVDFGVMAYELIRKIRILSGVKVITRRRQTPEPAPAGVLPQAIAVAKEIRPEFIGIGSSTGGPQALEKILGALPVDFPVPIVCIQHIAEGFMQGLVDWLAKSCRIRVCIAEQGATPQAGMACFPPEGRHLEIGESGRFHCSDRVVSGEIRPSVNLAFSSISRWYRETAAGVLLTGMGEDGAEGLLDIARTGGVTIAQDERSSVVFGMPRRAVELGAAQHVLPLDQIAPTLLHITHSNSMNQS